MTWTIGDKSLLQRNDYSLFKLWHEQFLVFSMSIDVNKTKNGNHSIYKFQNVGYDRLYISNLAKFLLSFIRPLFAEVCHPNL